MLPQERLALDTNIYELFPKNQRHEILHIKEYRTLISCDKQTIELNNTKGIKKVTAQTNPK